MLRIDVSIDDDGLGRVIFVKVYLFGLLIKQKGVVLELLTNKEVK